MALLCIGQVPGFKLGNENLLPAEITNFLIFVCLFYFSGSKTMPGYEVIII